MMTYSEQLQHPKWQERRLQILSKRGFHCEDCGDKETQLHVHHRRYVKGRKVWEYEDWELGVLCKKCHGMEHEARDVLARLLAEFGTSDIRQVCGYAAGLLLWREPGLQVSVNSYEAATGLADSIGGVTAEEVINGLDGGVLCSNVMSDLKHGKAN